MLLLVTMALSVRSIPHTLAKYVSDIPDVPSGEDPFETGISAISNDDLDTMLRMMMNERYPVGSIYITTNTAMNTPTAMANHFGGRWLAFGVERIPVGFAGTNSVIAPGVNTTNYFDDLGRNLGRTPGGTGGNNVTVSIAGQITGPTALSNGGGYWSDNGVAPTAPGGSVPLNPPSGTFASAQIGALAWPSHTHTSTSWSGGGDTTYHRRSNGSCCTVCCGTHTIYGDRGTGAATNVGGTVGGGQGFSLNVDWPSLPNATYNAPIISRSLPTWNNNPQQSISGFPLSYSLTQNAATIPDATLQPYVIVYMYIRDALAPVPPLP